MSMTQLALVQDDPVGFIPRPYQIHAADAIAESLKENRSCLLVMATGTGKSEVLMLVSQRMRCNTLVLNERTHLVHQIAKRFRDRLGEDVEIEQGDHRADGRARVVCASKDSLHESRLTRLSKQWTPNLIVCDEAHHAVSQTYTEIIDAFPDAKVLGVTATPDRRDESMLGSVFEDVAFVYEMDDAIGDGWLVPIRVKRRIIDEIILDKVSKNAGDFSQDALDRMMAQEKVAHQIARDTIDHGEGRRGIVFVPGVASSKQLAEVFNYYEPGSAQHVDGTTPHDQRTLLYAAHQRGDFRYLCNVNVLTEGYDDPMAALMVNAAPTLSRSRYAQRVGRVTRPEPGVTDAWADFRHGRLSAISGSSKPNCLVIDMVGSSAKHRLVGPEDVLGGKLPQEVVERAKKIAPEGGAVGEALSAAAAAIAAEREAEARSEMRKKARIVVTVRGKIQEFDPFDFYRIENREEKWGGSQRYGFRPPTEPMIRALKNRGIEVSEETSFKEAKALLDATIGRPTVKMIRALDRKHIDARKWPFELAAEALGYIRENGWGRAIPGVQRDEWERRAVEGRDPGEDG